MKKVGFFLMNKKGFNVLSKLIENKRPIDVVVSSRDKALKFDYYAEIKDLCIQNNIRFFDRREDFTTKIESDYIITIGWRWIIKGNLMNKLIVSHDSILPKYRGFAPLVNMLINNEQELGVSFLFASEKYDCGNIIVQKKRKINYPIKIDQAIEIVSSLFYEAINDVFEVIEKGNSLVGYPQNEKEATYSLWRNDDDYSIDLRQDAQDIARFVDAVGVPYLGASLFIENQRVRVLEVEVVDDVTIENREAGKVIFIDNGKPVIVCGSGLLKIITMIDANTLESILPLKNFRIRFKGRKL